MKEPLDCIGLRKFKFRILIFVSIFTNSFQRIFIIIFPEPIDIMEWGIVLRNWKCNKHTGTVSVLLAWNVPFNHSAVSSYTISCIINDVSDIPAIVRKTNKTEEWFDLDENTEYRIEVKYLCIIIRYRWQ